MEVQQNIVSNPITDIVPGKTEHNAFGCCAKSLYRYQLKMGSKHLQITQI
jgi:hypothetical protein